jgi:hypothetical protein
MGTWGSKLKSFFRRPVSHIIAPVTGLAGLLILVMNPMPDGDSWINRLSIGMSTGNWTGSGGGGAPQLFAEQVQQNIWTSFPLFATSVVAAIIGRLTKT